MVPIFALISMGQWVLFLRNLGVVGLRRCHGNTVSVPDAIGTTAGPVTAAVMGATGDDVLPYPKSGSPKSIRIWKIGMFNFFCGQKFGRFFKRRLPTKRDPPKKFGIPKLSCFFKDL